MLKKTVIFSLLAIVATPAMAETFGKFIDDKRPTEKLTKLMGENQTEKLVITEGTVKQVCEKKGCWMTLDSEGKTVRVFFKGYSFFVGKSLVGKKVKAEGKLQKKTQSVAAQKHYLEDGGASKAEIDKIKEPLETYTFEANAVATL